MRRPPNLFSEALLRMKILRYSLALSLFFLIPQPAWSDERADKEFFAEQILAAREAPLRTLHPEFRKRAITSLLERSLAELREAAETRAIVPLDLGDSTSDLVYNTLPQPCRIIDTRLAGGRLTSSRDFKVAGDALFEEQGGHAGGCGIPLGPAT